LHSKEFDSALINSNITTNEVASKEFQVLVSKLFAPHAPHNLSAVTFTRGGQGVEKAILTAMAERGQGRWTALGFAGSTHGNHTSFSLSQFRGHPKLPSLNWPTLAFPTSSSESSVLESVRSNLKSQRQSGSPIAAVVIEPMQSTTGNVASDKFLSELRSLTRENEAALIVDATETGCGATGKSFWGFEGEADYLVFGKRTQADGFYSTVDSKAHSISFGGDQLRLLQFQVIDDVIRKDNLIQKVQTVGESLKRQVESTVSKKSAITGVRGLGTSLFIDT
jgi:4-aminobutyrate aminotransferase-like enzyme